MKRIFSILAVILTALGGQIGNVQAQNPQPEQLLRDYNSRGESGFVGDQPVSGATPTPAPRVARRAVPARYAGTSLLEGMWAGSCGSGCDSGCDTPCDGGCDSFGCGLGGGCDGCSSCGGGDWFRQGCAQYFGGVEYMHVFLSGRPTPALVTTSSDPADEGVLGRPTTSVLFGDERLGNDDQAGGRITLGTWLDPSSCVGVGVKFFFLEGDSSGFSSASSGDPLLARPFFNADPNVQAEDSFLVAAPGIADGSLGVLTSSDMINAEVFVRYMLTRRCNFRLDLIGGYHFNRLDDGLVVSHFSTSIPPNGPAPIGSTFDVVDVFEVSNEFHGGELGLLGEWQMGCMTLSLLGKVSIGNIRQQLSISGQSTISDGAGGSASYVGGLLAQPNDNIGVYEDDETGFIPEAGITLSYGLTRHLDLTLGYTFMHWNNIALVGNQIDTTVNASQLSGGTLVGPARPTFDDFHQTSFWLQSINVGLSGSF